MTKIPVVFTFNDDYALPASIAVKSLFDCKKAETEYEIIVLHRGLSKRTKRRFKSICEIKWIEIKDKNFFNSPPLLVGAVLRHISDCLWTRCCLNTIK